MTMQELNRWERAALAIHERGERVTLQRLDRWLREHEGRGISPRDGVPIARRYREAAEPRISAALERAAAELEPLRGWERHEVLLELRRRYGRKAAR
jgi:hypothetical protein